MNKQITRLAVFAVVLVIALVVATTYWQTWAAPGLADRQDNAIQRVAEFTVKRGRIVAADGTLIARNRIKRTGGKTFYFRTYPLGRTFAHAVGYSTQVRSRAGLEQSLNDYLTAANANLSTVLDRTFDRIKGSTVKGNDVVLTLSTKGQQVAREALGNRCGSVVAIEPRTGRVLVLASSPSYDPNLIEGHFDQATRAPNAECRQPAAPLVNRATDGLYTPGSTFKVITAAAALDKGTFQLSSTFSDPGYCEEYGRRVFNYSDQGIPSGYGHRHPAPGDPELDQLRLLQHRQADRGPAHPRVRGALRLLLEAAARAARRGAEGERPLPEGQALAPGRSERGRPGAAGLRSGAAAGDAGPDGHGHGGDRKRRRRHEAVPRPARRLAGRRPGRDDVARPARARDLARGGRRDHAGDDGGRSGGNLDERADPRRIGGREDRNGGERRRARKHHLLHLLRSRGRSARGDRGVSRAAERGRRHHGRPCRQGSHGGPVGRATKVAR
jgi:hypothetical protein